MSEKDKTKIISISKETFDKMSEDMLDRFKENILNHFKEAQDVEFIILPREEIFDRYIENRELKDAPVVVLLDDQDEKERFEKGQEELINQVMEFKMPPHLPEILDADHIYEEQRQKQKQKHYVPRTIGKVNSKKKGGR